MTENEISKAILTASIEVHRTLGGPGLLESVYEEALAWELSNAGLLVVRQQQVPIDYKGDHPENAAQAGSADRVRDRRMQGTSRYHEVFEAQALTYLRLMKLKLALVINFGERLLKDGFHRVVNGL